MCSSISKNFIVFCFVFLLKEKVDCVENLCTEAFFNVTIDRIVEGSHVNE